MDISSPPFRVIGRRTPKVDAIDKVTGRAQFGADIALPRLSVGKVLRSPHAHARIRCIETTKAAALPGILAIITGKDLPTLMPGTPRGFGSATAREYYLSHEVLARDKVLFHGHAVAAVAATSSEMAERALDLIQVDYDVLPHVLDPLQAMRPGAVLVHADLNIQSKAGRATTASNIAEHLEMGRGDVERGFAEADVVVKRTFRTQVVHQGYIDPDSETAWVREDGSVIVWANTQTTFTQRHDLAMLLNLPLSKVRVLPTEVGGAFGGKESVDVVTNKPHVAAYRAPGATPTNFALESVIDEVGEALHMDPLAFRLKNVSRASDPMPDGVQLPSVRMRRATRLRRWTSWPVLRRTFAKPPWRALWQRARRRSPR